LLLVFIFNSQVFHVINQQEDKKKGNEKLIVIEKHISEMCFFLFMVFFDFLFPFLPFCLSQMLLLTVKKTLTSPFPFLLFLFIKENSF